MTARLPWLAAIAAALLAGCAAPGPRCDPADLPPEALYGAWQARFDGGATAQLLLRPHPDYAGVQGQVTRGSRSAQLAGDLNDAGQLALDESDDGRRISAVWLAELQAGPDGRCGRTFHGSWRRAVDEQTQPFVLTPIPNP